jgi:hypothetical protein
MDLIKAGPPKKYFKKYYRLTLVAPFFSYSYKHTHFASLDAPWPFSGQAV